MEIAEIIRLHGLWLEGKEDGKVANLAGADLSGADLPGVDLRGSNLSDANLTRADLTRAYLSGAHLSGANLTRANLSGADLSRANLTWADLSGAILTGAILTGANLSDADLRGANLNGANLTRAYLRVSNLTRANLTDANLRGADLRGANLRGANLPPLKTVLPEGAFTAYKKVGDGVVLTLLIPADAARTGSLVGKKCRADRAKVVSSSVEGETFRSLYDHSFTYKVGEMVTEPGYDGDTRVECTDGVHFFMTQEEAKAYY